MIYTVSVEGVTRIEGSLQPSFFEQNQITQSGGRRTDTVTVDLTNFIPDGTTKRDLCTVKCCSFIAEDRGQNQELITRTGSIRLMNVAAPYARSGNLRSGALVGHLFATENARTLNNHGHVWRLSNPFKVTVQQIPQQLELLVSGVRAGVSFGVTFEIEVD